MDEDERLVVVVNTGDDITLYGLRVSPDVDTVLYWLSGMVDRKKGWGQQGDTTHTLAALERFGLETWFRLGDKDLATHIYRTWLLSQGLTPTEVTARLARAFGVPVGTTVLPMTDSRVETWIETEAGEMHFQHYFVRERMKPRVLGVRLKGAESARPAPGVVESIAEARAVVICPSNPVISVGPILEVAGVREALRATRARVVAVSPLIGGRPVKGPADRLMRGLGMEVSSRQVARLYGDFLDVMVIDHADRAMAADIRAMGLECVEADTLMSDEGKARRLARVVLEAAGAGGVRAGRPAAGNV